MDKLYFFLGKIINCFTITHLRKRCPPAKINHRKMLKYRNLSERRTLISKIDPLKSPLQLSVRIAHDKRSDGFPNSSHKHARQVLML